MSSQNVLTYTNVSVPSEITSLATYNQGSLPIYVFIGTAAGGLYIYDISENRQTPFSISGQGPNLTAPINGLAVSDQYLFVNSPGNCFQLPLFPFYPSPISQISVTSVGNVYTRDTANSAGIGVTADSRVLFVPYGLQFISKIFPADSGSGLVNEVARVPVELDAYINSIAIDFVNTTMYVSDAQHAKIYTYDYSIGSNVVMNVPYIVGKGGEEYRGVSFSEYAGTLAYVVTNPLGIAGVFGRQTANLYDFPIVNPGTLRNTNAIAYDSFGGLYISTQTQDSSYTLIKSTYTYVDRPAPLVAPPRQKSFECGLFLPGSCKSANYQPFNARERFGWGSPNKPYRTLSLKDIEISCPPTLLAGGCPDTVVRTSTDAPPASVGQQIVPITSTTASAQEITRTRNLSTTRVLNLNVVNSVGFTSNISSSPVFDYKGRLYVLGAADGKLYQSDGASVLSTLIGGNFVASPACSSVDRTIVFGSLQGTLTMFDGTSNTVVWQKNLGTAIDKTPSYYASNVFVEYGSNLSAFDSATGNTLWSAAALTGGDTYSSPTNVQFGYVLVGTTNGVVYSYSTLNGTTLFSIPAKTGSILGAPNIGVFDRVYFGSGSNVFVCALDRTLYEEDVVYTNVSGNITTAVTLAVDNNKKTNAFFTTDSNYAYSVQIDDYTCNVTPNVVASNSLPVLDASYMYVMGTTGKVLRYRWNPLDFTVSNTSIPPSSPTTNFGPSVLIDASNQVTVITGGFIYTLS